MTNINVPGGALTPPIKLRSTTGQLQACMRHRFFEALSRDLFEAPRCTLVQRGAVCETALVCISEGFGGLFSGGFRKRFFGPVGRIGCMAHFRREIGFGSVGVAKSDRGRAGSADEGPNPSETQVVERPPHSPTVH